MCPSYYVFCLFYLMSFMFVMNMDDWFLVWFGLEMNMLSFLFLIYKRDNMFNVESCMKYFFIQSLGSAVLVGGFYLNESGLGILGPLILSYKMGGGPFYFWFPSICSGISWMSCFFLMSFQKLLPLMLLSEMKGNFLWFIMLVSLMVGMLGCFNQMNMKRLMAFSSIHQIGWLLMCLMVDKVFWMIYFLIYSIVLFSVIYKLNEYEILSFNVIGDLKSKWWLVLMMMNIGGMPPMLGFFLKWLGFYYFMSFSYFYITMMILMSVCMFYMYIRVCYSILMGMSLKFSWIKFYSGINLKFLGNLYLDMFMLVGSIMGGIIGFVFIL